MATNTDKWFVGQLPVSSAYVGETKVYPADSGGGGGEEGGDAHILVVGMGSSRRDLPVKSVPSYVAINGVEVAPKSSYDTTEFVEGDVVEFIADWEYYFSDLDWVEDIKNIGLNSQTGKRNQVVSGVRAFYKLNYGTSYFHHFTALDRLDTSNITTMDEMFKYANGYCDASGWDVSNVLDMQYAFDGQEGFYPQGANAWNTSKVSNMVATFRSNRRMYDEKGGLPPLDISEWCVRKISSRPSNFGVSSWDDELKPKWGTCPRGEV